MYTYLLLIHATVMASSDPSTWYHYDKTFYYHTQTACLNDRDDARSTLQAIIADIHKVPPTSVSIEANCVRSQEPSPEHSSGGKA